MASRSALSFDKPLKPIACTLDDGALARQRVCNSGGWDEALSYLGGCDGPPRFGVSDASIGVCACACACSCSGWPLHS